MICQIMRKEILENLLSLRFILSLLLIILLFAVSGFVFVGQYRQQLQDYGQETNKNLSTLNEHSKQLYKLVFNKQDIWRKPTPLVLCAEGFEKNLPNYFSFNVFMMDLPKVRERSNITLPQFSNIDWVFIISLLLSFVALIFTYDSICGEREMGTLRLILAGPIPRYKILLGKYFGSMFILGIPILLGLLINLIIVLSSNIITISDLNYFKIFAIILLSFLYLSIFILLGVFVSSRTVHSANSMVVLLLVWVGLVILIPSFGRIISEVLYNIPTQAELERRVTETAKQVDSDVISGKYGKNAGVLYSNPDHPSNNPPARARYQNALTDAKNQVHERYHNQIIAQAFTGRNFASISPFVIYRRASEAMAGTGISRCTNLYQQIKRYQGILKEYILDKDKEDPDSLHLLFNEEHPVVSWGAISKKPVSFNTIPKFQEEYPKLSESLLGAIGDIGLLALFNLVFFTAAFVSFLRYDAR